MGACITSYGVGLSPECIKAPMRLYQSDDHHIRGRWVWGAGLCPSGRCCSWAGCQPGNSAYKGKEACNVVNMTLCMSVNLMSVHGSLVISRTEQIANIYQSIPEFPKSDCRVEQETKEKFWLQMLTLCCAFSIVGQKSCYSCVREQHFACGYNVDQRMRDPNSSSPLQPAGRDVSASLKLSSRPHNVVGKLQLRHRLTFP